MNAEYEWVIIPWLDDILRYESEVLSMTMKQGNISY